MKIWVCFEDKTMDLNTIGGFVYTEEHGMCSWIGETVALWAKFDTTPARQIPIGLLRQHLIEALPREDENKPDGFIRAIAFRVKQ